MGARQSSQKTIDSTVRVLDAQSRELRKKLLECRALLVQRSDEPQCRNEYNSAKEEWAKMKDCIAKQAGMNPEIEKKLEAQLAGDESAEEIQKARRTRMSNTQVTSLVAEIDRVFSTIDENGESCQWIETNRDRLRDTATLLSNTMGELAEKCQITDFAFNKPLRL